MGVARIMHIGFALQFKGLAALPSRAIEFWTVRTQHQYNVRVVDRLESMRERLYAISVKKKVKHPAVLAIADGAREKLFG